MEVERFAVLKAQCEGGRPPVAVCWYEKCLRSAYPSQGSQSCYHTITVHHHTPSSLATQQMHTLDSGAAHREPVQAMAFSPAPPPAPLYLCSASQGSTTLWRHQDSGEYCPGELWRGSDGEMVSDVVFSSDSQHMAECRGCAVAVYNTQSCTLVTRLVGHTAAVSTALFTSLQPLTVISLSQDRTFKVWNLEDCSVSFQSHVISSSPFLSAAISEHHQHLASATADGMIRVFDLREGGGYNCLLKCDVSRELSRHQQEGGMAGEGVAEGGVVEAGCVVLGLAYVEVRNGGGEGEGEELLSPCVHQLLVVLQTQLLALDPNTLQLLHCVDLSEPLQSDSERHCLPVLGTCDCAVRDSQVMLISGTMFTDQVTLLNLSFSSSPTTPPTSEEGEPTSVLSVLSNQPLEENSPLRSVFNLKAKSATDTKGHKARATGRPANSGRPISDQPLTFKSKVKSSGYTAVPRMNMFTSKARKPAGSPGKAASFPGKLAGSPGKGREAGGGIKRSYPEESGPTSHLHHTTRASDHTLPIYSVSFTGSGSMLACGSADRSLYTIRIPPNSGRLSAFTGHDGAVLNCGWSHSEHWLVSSSTDRRACVWGVGGAWSSKDTPLLVLDRIQHNMKPTDSQVKDDNQFFKKEISFCQFYYMDRFLLLCSGNSLHLYKFHIDTQPPDDIKRYLSNCRYKLVTTVQMHSSQSITAVSAINDFHSYLVLVSGSNRALEVHDMNVGKCVRTIPSPHSRPVHCISQSKGSKFVSLESSHYDLFTTSAVSEGVKLWDLRTSRCVCCYGSHANPSQPVVMATISPCARYLATGSENRSAYIYDLRHPAPLHRLGGHSDTVSAVAYHPLRPMLATSTLDGQLKFFIEESIK